LRVSNGRVRVLALKKAEESDEIVVRVVELDGRSAPGVRLAFPVPVTAAREIDGSEKPLGRAQLANGELTVDLAPSAIRSFAVRLAAPLSRATAPRSTPVVLPYDLAVASVDGARSPGGFEASGRALAAELVPSQVDYAGIRFDLAPATSGQPNALAARGQALPLPAGRFNRAYILAAADGDQPATFRAGANAVDVTVQDWSGFIGQWDNRTWSGELEQGPPGYDLPDAPPPTFPRYLGLKPGFIKPAPVAWFASHTHTASGANAPYAYAYLYAYAIDLPAGEKTLTLPSNEKIRILAVSVAEEGEKLRPACPLFDTLQRTP
jgi:alpha-mannosidase